MLPKLKRIPMKDRVSLLYLERGELDVLDGAFVLVDKTGVRVQIPVGAIACLMLEPGTRVSHAAVTLAARVGCLLVWVGEGGVRLYSAGRPGGARSDRLLHQARLALDDAARLRVVRHMYALRFKEEPPPGQTPDQLRTLEGQRVRALYQLLARQYRVEWSARRYDPNDWTGSDPINKALSAATACLYGVTEAAILAAGYSPAIGFLHSGKPLSFVYDIADLLKFETVVPVAFRVVSQGHGEPDRAVRLGCRDMFRQTRMLDRLVPLIEETLAAGGLDAPAPPPEAQPVAFPDDSDLEGP